VLTLSALGLVAGGLVGTVALATPAAAAAPAPAVAPISLTALAAPASTATRVSISVSSTSITAYDPLAVWGRVYYGSSSILRGETVVLQQYVGPGWRSVAWARANNSGYASYTIYPSGPANYRLYFGGAPGFAAAGSAAPAIKVAPATRASRVVAIAASKSGDWYVFGAAGPTVFDCSGLTMYAFKQVGINLPHLADAQKRYGVGVSAAQARPGDLIIFLSGGYGYHAGIYAGGGYMYDAPHEGATVGKHKIFGTNYIFRRLV
jgi:cell wall-associated NlpC family hydrolase